MAYLAFTNHIHFKEAVANLLLPFGNVELFDFQPVADITHNLNNYKDLTHYSLEINEYIVKSFQNGQHRITADNTQALLSVLDSQVRTALDQSAIADSIFYHCAIHDRIADDSGAVQQ